jgi:hypothetical protein
MSGPIFNRTTENWYITAQRLSTATQGIGTNLTINANNNIIMRTDNVIIGRNAGFTNQGTSAIAIGLNAGATNQGTNAIAIGSFAGQGTQGTFSVAIGYQAGQATQSQQAIAIGYQAGQTFQGTNAISIGFKAGQGTQGTFAIAIGFQAGSTNQSQQAIAIGYLAGSTNQGTNAVAIGTNSAIIGQGRNAIAIGGGTIHGAGFSNQGTSAIAFGGSAGQTFQGQNAIAIGQSAGAASQGTNAIAIGFGAGGTLQRTEAIAIGANAGSDQQGRLSIALGYQAGQTNQAQNSIVINATGGALNAQSQSAFYAAPIRQASAANALYYDPSSSEIVYNNFTVGVTEIANFSNYAQTVKQQSIPYLTNQQITTSNITPKLDNWIDNAQVYTFGPTAQARFVATGTNAATPTATIFYSADGITWIASPTTLFNGAGGVVNEVTYNGTVWVAVGTNASTSPTTTIAYSYDGISWTAASGTTFGTTTGAQGRGVAWGGNKFVAVGTSGGTAPSTTSVYSYDGINWIATATNGTGTGMWSTATYSGSGWGVAYNRTRWIAVGGDGNTTLAAFTNCKCIYYSEDGITWTNATSGSPFFTQSGTGAIARAVAWNGIKWIAVGTDSTSIVGGQAATRSAFSSLDGITWTVINQNIFGSNLNANLGGWCIAWNGVRWVTGGTFAFTSGSMFYSTDGNTWTACTGNTFNVNSAGFCRGICWNGYIWIANGVSGNSSSLLRTMSYSYDGIIWTATPINVFGFSDNVSSGYGIAYNSVRTNMVTFPRNIIVGGGSYLGTTTLAVSSSSAISGTTMTVTTYTSGSFQIGQIIIGGTTAANTYIIAYGTGTGTTGTYIVSISQTVAAAALSGVPNSVAYSTASSIAVTTGILTVGGTVAGALYKVGQLLTGTGVPANTYITGYGTGTGGAGTYTTNIITAVASTAITGLYATSLAYSTDSGFSWSACGGTYATPGTSTASTITVTTGVLTVGGTVTGLFQIGQLLTGTGVPANTYITGLLTGSGGTGTYSTNTTTAVASTSINGSTSTNSTTYGIATNGYMWLASTQNSATASFVFSTLSYSFDGINWSVVPNFATNIMGNGISAQVRGIAWSPVLNIWVAVGTGSATPAAGSYQLAYSYDGLNWVGVPSVIFGSGANSSVGNCVAWGKDKFVAGGGNSVAAGNRVYYSYDGKTWIVGTPIFATSYSAVAYNGTMWVATGNNANSFNTGLGYSYDGITWALNPTATIFSLATNIGAIAWSPALNIWVAGSGDTTNTLYYSYNGINWTGCTGSLSGGTTCQTLCWTGNKFIGGWSVMGPTQFYTSSDGINWVATGPVMFTSNFSLAWSSNQPNSGQQLVNVAIQQPTLAFGSGTNSIAYSYDGINWTGLGTGAFTSAGTAYGGCWNGKLWVAGGANGSGAAVMVYSYDGINWTTITQSVITTIVYNIAWNGTVFVAVGQSTISPIAYSYNGINWIASATPAATLGFTRAYCVGWGQNYFVVGAGGAGTTNNYAYSTDGINWTGGIITGTTAGVEFRGVICGQSLWVIVGTTGISPRGYWAINPTSTWTAGTGFAGGAVSRLNSISFGIYPVSSIAAGTTYGTIFCVGGLTASSSSSGYVYSTNGKTWTTSASGNTAFNNQQLNSLTWNGKRFIGIAGTTATNTRIAYSYDAQTWYTTGITPTSSQLFTTAGYGVASSAWPTLGSVYVDNALALSSTSGVNTINKLDIYSDTYFNNGYNNAEFTVKSTQL